VKKDEPSNAAFGSELFPSVKAPAQGDLFWWATGRDRRREPEGARAPGQMATL